MSSVIEEIKSRLNIVDVLSGYLKLEKAGGNFKARCPFHNEKSPSFFVSPSRQTYHCFGCNRGGDVISFVEEIEGLDFSGALKVLAERAGVELTRERGGVSKETRDEREMIYRTLDLASKFYEAVLPKFPEALAYLKKRGLSEETIKKFRVGFAPDEWRPLGDFLAKKGVSEVAMERAGLIVRSERGYYDRFRGRVMFPIADSSGRVIAFSGRILKEEAGKTLGASASAKYVNSPETEVFHKSRALFGFHLAKETMRQMDTCVLVEGQMDLILSHQAGVTNTVAVSGTALTADIDVLKRVNGDTLTKDHLSLIKRFTKNLVLAFDADDAGLAAAHRAVGLALSQDMTVRIAKLPRGMDPADVALKDPLAWKDAVRTAKNVIDFYLELLPSLHAEPASLRAKVSEIIVPFIAELHSAIDQGHYVGEIAKLLRIKDEPVWEEVKKQKSIQRIEEKKEDVLRAVAPLSRKMRLVRAIRGVMLWQKRSEAPFLADIPLCEARLEKILAGDPSPGEFGGEEELIFEAEARFHGSEHPDRDLEEMMQGLEEETLRERFAKKMDELKEAERKGDIDTAQRLLVECQEISKDIQKLTSL